MKAFIALCFLAVAAAAPGAELTAEQSAKLREYHKECTESSKVAVELVAKARKGDFSDDVTLDHYFNCMFKKCDFIDDEGKLKADVIKQKAPAGVSEEDITHVLTACAKVQTEAKEKIAKLAYKCYLTETKVKLQLLPETKA